MSVEERLKSLKENTSKKKCTFGDENDREGYLYEIRDTDFAWMLGEIYSYKKIAESQARILEGFISDIENIKARLNFAMEDLNNSDIEKAYDRINVITNVLLVNFDTTLKQ